MTKARQTEPSPHEAVIVASVRTAVGKAPKGALRQTRPDDMAAAAIRARPAARPGARDRRRSRT